MHFMLYIPESGLVKEPRKSIILTHKIVCNLFTNTHNKKHHYSQCSLSYKNNDLTLDRINLFLLDKKYTTHEKN